MPTEVESICCNEWNIAMPKLQDDDDIDSIPSYTCLTEDPEFSPLLSRSVLHVVFSLPRINWRRRPKPEGPNGTLSIEQCRLVAYRVVLEWMLKGEHLGRRKRKVLPSCVVKAVRDKYPSPSGRYVGFTEAENAFAML
ncbi:hypothetical protein R3I93_012490 [Phoxinus phoxinus]